MVKESAPQKRARGLKQWVTHTTPAETCHANSPCVSANKLALGLKVRAAGTQAPKRTLAAVNAQAAAGLPTAAPSLPGQWEGALVNQDTHVSLVLPPVRSSIRPLGPTSNTPTSSSDSAVQAQRE